LSRRILAVKSSPTVALNGKAKALARDGVKVLNFAVGEPDFKTPDIVVDAAVAAMKAGRTKYGPAGGGPEFRAAIAKKLKAENGLDFSPDDIVCGIGAKEILFHIVLALVNDGDEVLIPSPYWVSYPDQVIAAGGKPVLLPLSEDIAGKPLTIDMLKRHESAKTTAIILNSPNNPAGYVFDEKFLKELGAYLETKNWWIVSDEIYEYLAFDRPHVSLLKLFPSLKDRFIHVNGMSKGFAMTGWRVGYAAGPQSAMKLVRDLQSHSSTCLPPFIEEAATLAIAKGEGLLHDQFQVMRKRRDLAISILKQMPGVTYVQPNGAFYVFIDVRERLKGTRFDGDTFALSDHLLMQHHIALVPGEAFGAPGFLRLSYATDEATIEAGLLKMKEAMKGLT
jgi:aspartate aminotransferase